MEAGLIDSHDIRKILFQSELMWHPKMPYIVEGLLWRELSRRLADNKVSGLAELSLKCRVT
jgi:hypothetical protein